MAKDTPLHLTTNNTDITYDYLSLLVTNLFDIISQVAQEIQLNKNLLVFIPFKTSVISGDTDGPLTVHIIYITHVICC